MSFTDDPAAVGVPFLVAVTLASLVIAVLLLTGDVTGKTTSVLTSLLLVVVTATYAYLTYGLLLESRETRRREAAPVLTIITDQSGQVPELLNVGNGPVRRGELTLCAVADDGSETETELTLRNLDVNQSMPILEEPFSKLTDENAGVSDEYTKLRVTGKIRDAFGDSIRVKLEYELSEIGPPPTITRGPRSSALEKIAVELERLRESEE